MDPSHILDLESKIIAALKTVYDPEIPVNIYDLGLIYNLDVDDDANVKITMTLTAPNCPMADVLVWETQEKTEAVEGVNKVEVNLVFEPLWSRDRMSEEALMELGML